MVSVPGFTDITAYTGLPLDTRVPTRSRTGNGDEYYAEKKLPIFFVNILGDAASDNHGRCLHLKNTRSRDRDAHLERTSWSPGGSGMDSPTRSPLNRLLREARLKLPACPEDIDYQASRGPEGSIVRQLVMGQAADPPQPPDRRPHRRGESLSGLRPGKRGLSARVPHPLLPTVPTPWRHPNCQRGWVLSQAPESGGQSGSAHPR